MKNYYDIRRLTRHARKLVIRGTTAAGSGHPGGSFSMAEIVRVIFSNHLRHNPQDPLWENRDKLILSKGHAAPGLYANLAVAGYIGDSELDSLRGLGSRLQGHPDLKCPGVEFCGGSLGIGLSFSIGAALAARLDGRDTTIYTILGDGETDEGQVWEAAMTASKYRVDNLVAILDRNFVQQDSFTEKVMPLDSGMAGDDPSEMWDDPGRWRTASKWRSFGWHVIEIDGHRIEEIDSALSEAGDIRGAPVMIIARTIKGRGVEHMESNPQWHGKSASDEMVPLINAEIDSQSMIAPSIIAGDMDDLARTTIRCADAGADIIHLDVMDGRFVPQTALDVETIRELRPVTKIPFDTHLMIESPEEHVQSYADAGSDIVTVHAEACDETTFAQICDILKKSETHVGLAINPGTEIPEWSHKFLAGIDQIIVMSVNPGRSGQKFIESTHEKMGRIVPALREHGFDGIIEMDGGVTPQNIGSCFEDGARSFVGGSAIAGSPDVGRAVADFAAGINRARRLHLMSLAKKRGGAELLNRWISLHRIGDAPDILRKIAADEGLL